MAGDGEILVSGPTVAPGAGPVLATGDLGEWRPDGALRVAGRKADTIVSGGENVAPAEVEAVLEAHPDVVEAAVHGRARPASGARRSWPPSWPTPSVEAEELRAWCAARLAGFKVPKEIAFTVALPRTPSGKVARKEPAMSDDARASCMRAAGRRWPPAGRRRGANFQRRWSPSRSGWSRRSTRSRATACSSWRPGLGDTGLLAAQLVAPGGSVLITDGSEAMVEAAREHAEEVGATNVELRTMQAEWIDLPTASVDGVHLPLRLHAAARPRGGAARDAARAQARRAGGAGRRGTSSTRNPWMKVLREALVAQRAWRPRRRPTGRGRSRWAPRSRSPSCSTTAGFDDIEVRAAGPRLSAPPSLDAWWDHVMQTSITTAEVVRGLAPAEHYALRDLVDAGYSPYVRDDGSLEAPARALVAAAAA